MTTPTPSHKPVALISDVHGNLTALHAVLADIDKQGIERIVVAGDMVGFGPHPDAVVDLLRAREAEMIRGNHEKDYVAPYRTPAEPAHWRTDTRIRSMLWSLERLGPERRAFLTGLPDALWLDAETLVVHGSPRHVRDAVLPWTPEPDLVEMFAGVSGRLAFMGHTHRAVIREAGQWRLVNLGSVGLPTDGDSRASYVIATPPIGNTPGAWELKFRRVPFDVEAAIAAYGNGLRETDPAFVEIMAAELRFARDFFGRWMRISSQLSPSELPTAQEEYLRTLSDHSSSGNIQFHRSAS